jgi:hypothetical protein
MGKCEKKKECAQPLRLPRESNSCFTPALSSYLATTKDFHHLILLLETFDLETRERVEVAGWKVLVVSTRDGQAEPGDGTKRRTSKSEPEGTKASFGARAACPRDASARTRRLHLPWEMDSLIFKVRERRGVGFATWRVLVVRTKNDQAEPVYATKRRGLGERAGSAPTTSHQGSLRRTPYLSQAADPMDLETSNEAETSRPGRKQDKEALECFSAQEYAARKCRVFV